MRKLLCILIPLLCLCLTAAAVDIDSADDLLALMQGTGDFSDLTATYTLTKNIDMTGVSGQSPIAPTASAPFTGVFDGAGYTISGLKIEGGQYSGLFGILHGTVKDLTVKGSVSSGDANDAGGIAGLALDGAHIENCASECTVSGKNSVAGIVGRVKSGDYTIENCINRGTVSAVREAGGIVGYADASGTLTVQGCTNYGAISLTSTNERAGGILGGSSSRGTIAIHRCVNRGTVTGARNVGGIAGLFEGKDVCEDTALTRIMTECVNYAAITSTATSGNAGAGGIIGYFKRAGGVTDCLNLGKVTSTVHGIGGVIGVTEVYGNIGYSLSRCSVSCPADSDRIGVFGGYLPMRPSLPNFYTSGTVGKIYANVDKYAYRDFVTLNTSGVWVNPYEPTLAWMHTHSYTERTVTENGCGLACLCGEMQSVSAHTDSGNGVCSACGTSLAKDLTTVYVSDGGSGDGSAAGKPLASLTRAYEALGTDGGTIVIVDTVTVPKNRIGTKETAFVEPFHDGKITVKGADADAVLRFSGVYQYHMSGETEFSDLTFASASSSAYIDMAGRGYPLTMGEGLSMQGNDAISGTQNTKIIVYGGYREGAVLDGAAHADPCLTVKSGSYYAIRGFNRTVDITSYGKATLTVGGDVYTKYLEAGSTSYSHFSGEAGATVSIIGDVTVATQLSLGNPADNQYVFNFDTDLYLLDGKVTFTGTGMDYKQRERLSGLRIFVDPDSADAMDSYLRLFAGYGDEESALKEIPETAAIATTALPLQNGVYTYQKGALRVQILSDTVVRAEVAENGIFTDADTLMITGREEYTGTYTVSETVDGTVVLSTPAITVNIPADSERAEDVRIYDKNGALLYSLFTADKNALYSLLPSAADTPNSLVLFDNGILPPEEGLTYAGRTDATSGWSRNDHIDMYILLPRGDAKQLRTDFVTLTGRTMLSDIKTLGSWYSRWTTYTDEEKLAMIEKYRDRDVPLDIIIIDTEWKNTSQNGNDGDGTGYEYNTDLYPNMPSFLKKAEEAGVLVLFNDHTHKTSLKINDPAELKWQTEGIQKVMADGLDGWWYDRNWSYSVKTPFHDVTFETIGQKLYYDVMAAFHKENANGATKRVLMLSNVDWLLCGYRRGASSLISHRYGTQWTGDIYGDPTMLRREIKNMVFSGATGSSPYMSSDLGGFRNNDAVTENMFIRWMQFGAFSPVFRVHSSLGVKNEHYPWSYSEASEAIVRDFLHMRYHLIPFYYALARENYETGMPLARRLDFHYPDANADDTEYLLGRDILVAPYWSAAGEGNVVVPSSWLQTADGEEGLTAEYFITDCDIKAKGTVSGEKVLTETVPNVDFYWHRDSACGEQWDEEFAVRYTGKITPDVDCYLGIYADNGARVYIDGTLAVDGWDSHGLNTNLGDMLLKAGETHDLLIDYFEATGQAQVFFVYEPVQAKNTSVREVYIPEGEWIDVFTGETVTGPQTLNVTKGMETLPIYVRKGAILPASAVVSPMTGADWQTLSLNVYDVGNGACTLYEDDGATEDYMNGAYRKTEIASVADGNTVTVTLSAADGDFATDYAAREITLRFHSDKAVISATVNGASATVTRIIKDTAALPFADTGASPITDVYAVTFTAPTNAEHTVVLTVSDTAPAEGDVDLDGAVSVKDALLSLKALVKGENVIDLTGDGKLTLIDILRILRLATA